MKTYFSLIVMWLPFAAVITILSALIYVSVQSEYRQSFNDPQIQIAEDTANSLNNNEPVNPSGRVDISKSLSPFVIIFDKNKQVKVTNAYLDQKTPTPPGGVFTDQKDTKIAGENRFTWEPKDGVRIAAVTTTYKDGYVLVGRNMRELEIRVARLEATNFGAWLLALVTTFILVAFKKMVFRKHPTR